MTSCIVFSWCGLYVRKNRQIEVLNTWINQYAIFVEIEGSIDPHVEVLSRSETLPTVMIKKKMKTEVK